jgi:hypothetical protein
MKDTVCDCGHWFEEHSEEGGCAGCDAGGHSLVLIEHPFSMNPIYTYEGRAEQRALGKEMAPLWTGTTPQHVQP